MSELTFKHELTEVERLQGMLAITTALANRLCPAFAEASRQAVEKAGITDDEAEANFRMLEDRMTSAEDPESNAIGVADVLVEIVTGFKKEGDTNE